MRLLTQAGAGAFAQATRRPRRRLGRQADETRRQPLCHAGCTPAGETNLSSLPDIMTPTQIELVRTSHALVQPIAKQAASMFYANLFEADPTLRGLFRGDMDEQGRRLFDMITAGISLLDRPAQLLPVLRRLGGLHVSYGVVDAHYDTVGLALLKTFAQALGDRFSPSVAEAWEAFYGVVSRTMREGAADVSAPVRISASVAS
jgi:hemoglobin-like flavoprotein